MQERMEKRRVVHVMSAPVAYPHRGEKGGGDPQHLPRYVALRRPKEPHEREEDPSSLSS